MTPKHDGIYAMYLRKSRADLDAEKIGKYETLSKHKKMLSDLAKKYDIKIAKVYKELVSGDTIEARPQMKLLLAEVKSGIYDGVLVTEISRLARGNTTDQGIVSEAFRDSKTLIITPSKIYDPTDEADETFFDFELFMARQEYRYIKKRMQRGREQSRENGNWIFGHVPIGYKKEGLRLVPDENAPIMRSALLDLANGEKNKTEVVLFLRQAIPSRKWNDGSCGNIFANPIYAGYMKTKPTYPLSYDPDSYIKANCEPLISLQDHANIIRRMTGRAKNKKGLKLRNAFAGLVRCSKCGRVLVYNYDHGYPVLSHQHGVSAPKCVCFPVPYKKAYNELTRAIIDALPYQKRYKKTKDNSDLIKELQNKLKNAERIKANLFDSYENGLYTASEFKERKIVRDQEIDGLKRQISTLERKQKRTAPIAVDTDDLKSAILEDDPERVNELLRLLIERIDYTKESKSEEPIFTLFFK